MSDGRQRQRHGVAKNLAQGIGGLLVGAAAVLLLREWLGRRRGPAPAAPAALSAAGPLPAAGVAAGADRQPRPAPAAPAPRRRPRARPPQDPAP